MSIGSLSFWQQDANYWNRSQARDQSLAQSAALITAMGNAITSQTQGLASIANQTALNRVNTALTAAIQSALQSSQDGSGSSSSAGTAGSSSSSPSAASGSTQGTSATFSAPALGTGTIPLTPGTTLLALGILPSGTVTVSEPGNANVAAWLNGKGDLVISGKTDFDNVNVGGTYAPAIGFGSANNSFQPVTPSSSTSTSGASTGGSSTSSPSVTSSSPSTSANGAPPSSAAAGGTNQTAGSSIGASPGSTSSGLINSALALQTGGTAEYLLASSGSSGTLLNLLT